MLREESEAVSEGNGPVHREEKIGFGQSALADEYREVRNLSKQQEIRLEMITRLLEQLSECLEHEARQSRLAMEADRPADTKTRERTEGTATAVQAMRGDAFSARRVKSGPNTNSTSFGVKVEPPALPCRDNVVVESRGAASESCLPSLEMHSSTAAGGVVPTCEASTAKETNFNQPPFGFARPRRRIWRRVVRRLQFRPPRTTAAASSRRGTCLLLPIAGGSLTQTPGKIGLLIQAVHEVTSAPAHFWDRGTRWVVARLYGLGQLVTSCSVFS